MKERIITGTGKACRMQRGHSEMAAWIAGQHRSQQGWSRKHRSNLEVSEHFLDKDMSIWRQMTFNDATGAEKQPREQLIS